VRVSFRCENPPEPSPERVRGAGRRSPGGGDGGALLGLLLLARLVRSRQAASLSLSLSRACVRVGGEAKQGGATQTEGEEVSGGNGNETREKAAISNQ
jgi:hypothetical protein